MRKKSGLIAVAIACLLTCTITVYGRDIFGIRSVMGTAEQPASCTISTAAGETLTFSAADLERRLGIEPGTLGGVTITALPSASQGSLYLDDAAVRSFDFVSRQQLDRLRFVPNSAASAASISFLPQCADAVATSLAIKILSTPNKAPVIEDMDLETVVNTARSAVMTATDPESGGLRFQVIKKPEKGAVVFSGGAFTYQPYKDAAGADLFTVCAIDNASLYSREATVNVRIDKSGGFYYADMLTHPSAYAAIKLREAGVAAGVTMGGKSFFHPYFATTRGDFLIMLLAAAGKQSDVTPCVNTGLPNDADIPAYLKPYVAAALRAGIWLADTPFPYNEVPLRSEAVVLTARAAAIDDVKDYQLGLPDAANIPDWALPSYKELAAYRMLDLHDGYALPKSALSNSYSADLLWQLYKHCHR